MTFRPKGDFAWVQDIKEKPCNAPSCGVLTSRRFCLTHQEVYRLYGATAKGPSKRELVAAQRFVQHQLGPVHKASPALHSTIAEAASIALRLPQRLFEGSRGNRVAWSAYRESVNLVERLKAYHAGEDEAVLMVRFWWAFIAVQYLELSGQFLHQDRHHFLTSVQRLIIRCHGKERPSTSYTKYVMTELDKLWAIETGRVVGAIAQEEKLYS